MVEKTNSDQNKQYLLFCFQNTLVCWYYKTDIKGQTSQTSGKSRKKIIEKLTKF
jgi:hypothetical protein